MTRRNVNPFEDRTPENMDPSTIAALFEDVYVDVPLVSQRGHTFINGPRGSGKSMMLQYLLPEVQRATMTRLGIPFTTNNLEEYCFYFGIRGNSIKDLFEIKTTDDAYTTLAHHFICVNLMKTIIKSFSDSMSSGIIQEDSFNISGFYEKFISICKGYGISTDIQNEGSRLAKIEQILENEIDGFNSFCRRASVSGDKFDVSTYSLGVTTFLDLIYPLLEISTKFSSKHFFLMIDDADELSDRMQKIINTWVSYRTNKILSIKVSTQMRYGSYRTISNSIIESPHDFNIVDLSQIYTSRQAAYFHRVERIVDKRLKYYNIESSVEDYFPPDRDQEMAIEEESNRIKLMYKSGEKRVSARINDDIYRYSIPNYMVSLVRRKKSNLFSYSGFKTLVNISSGVVRFFLEPASQMYNKQLQKNGPKSKKIKLIEPSVQNEVSRSWATQFAKSEMEELVNLYKESPDDVKALENLVAGLGELFTRKLLDESSSERRVFSIFTPPLPKDLEKIVKLGISYGYFQRSSIRSKEATGIKDEIILSRRLAPHFYLDPTGYSGRLSVETNDLRKATVDPKMFVKIRINKGKKPLFDESVEPLFTQIDSIE